MANEKTALAQNAKASFFVYGPAQTTRSQFNIWSPSSVDKLDFSKHGTFAATVQKCRFYYRHDSLASSVINKMVDLAINDLVFIPQGTISVTEKAIFNSLSTDIITFLQKCAREYLTTGLVVPEIKLTRITQTAQRDKNIKR